MRITTSAPRMAHTTRTSWRRVLPWLAALGSVAFVGATGCQLQTREEVEQQKRTTDPTHRVQPLIDEAAQLEQSLQSHLDSATEARDLAAERANDFLKVGEGVVVRQLNLKAIREILMTCWKRPADEAQCTPPKRAMQMAQKAAKSKSQPTAAFLDDKLQQVEGLRPALRDDLPQAADKLADAAEETRAKLADLRARFDAEVSRNPEEMAALDPKVGEMQVMGGRIESKLGDADTMATEMRQSAEVYQLSVESAIEDYFMLTKKKK